MADNRVHNINVKVTLKWNKEFKAIEPDKTMGKIRIECQDGASEEYFNVINTGTNILFAGVVQHQAAPDPISVDLNLDIFDAVMELIKTGRVTCWVDSTRRINKIAEALRQYAVRPLGVSEQDGKIDVEPMNYALDVIFAEEIKIAALGQAEPTKVKREMLRARSRKFETLLQQKDETNFLIADITPPQLKNLVTFLKSFPVTLKVWDQGLPSELEVFCNILQNYGVVARGYHGERMRESLCRNVPAGGGGIQPPGEGGNEPPGDPVHPPQNIRDYFKNVEVTLKWNHEFKAVEPDEKKGRIIISCPDGDSEEWANVLEIWSNITFQAAIRHQPPHGPISVDVELDIFAAVKKLIETGRVTCLVDSTRKINKIARALRQLEVHPPVINYEDAVIVVTTWDYQPNAVFVEQIEIAANNQTEPTLVPREMLRARSRKFERLLEQKDITSFEIPGITPQNLKNLVTFLSSRPVTLKVWALDPPSELEMFCNILQDYGVVARGYHGERMRENFYRRQPILDEMARLEEMRRSEEMRRLRSRSEPRGGNVDPPQVPPAGRHSLPIAKRPTTLDVHRIW